MKPTILIYCLSFWTLFSCTCQNKKNDVPVSDTTKTQTQTQTHSQNEKLETFDFHSQPIPYKESIEDISRLLSHQHKGLKELRGYSFGGIFCVSQVYNPKPTLEKDTVEGVMMWYGLNIKNQLSGFQKFFLGSEPKHKTQVNFETTTTTPLNLPRSSYSYTKTKTDFATVKKYLEDITTTSTSNCDVTTTSNPAKHQLLISEYRTFLDTHLRVDGLPFNEVNWAYFQNNFDKDEGEGILKCLITQQPNIEYIRYFFGYDEGKTGRNSIRIILFAVDPTTKKNITTYVVQKSIPPAKKNDVKK